MRDAAQDTTAERVTERGLASVTMSQIARETGIGRAALHNVSEPVELFELRTDVRRGGSIDVLQDRCMRVNGL